MLPLTCHPESRRVAVQVSAGASRGTTGGTLAMTYRIEGDLERLRIPNAATPRIADRLWQHTCCEAFVRQRDAVAYHEFNFSPSGEWAAYAFERYREGGPLADAALEPRVSVNVAPTTLTLRAVIRLPLLSPAYARADLALGLSVVVEDESGAFSYWALRHAPGKPDFHHADAFALEIA